MGWCEVNSPLPICFRYDGYMPNSGYERSTSGLSHDDTACSSSHCRTSRGHCGPVGGHIQGGAARAFSENSPMLLFLTTPLVDDN